MNVFEKPYEITVGDVDEAHKIKPSALFDFFQDITTIHGENLGVGLDVMLQHGLAWVLSRMSVLIVKRPLFGETIKLKTWPRGSEHLFCLRDYEARDESGEIVVRARSGWIVLDVNKRRPLRPQALPKELPLNEGLDALIGGAAGIKNTGNFIKSADRKVFYSDIDYNGHVNNARYIQWIQDIMPPEFIEADKFRFDINYVSEIKKNELVDLLTLTEDEKLPTPAKKFAVEGKKTLDGQTSFRAEIRIPQ